jgi:hypothetical protein
MAPPENIAELVVSYFEAKDAEGRQKVFEGLNKQQKKDVRMEVKKQEDDFKKADKEKKDKKEEKVKKSEESKEKKGKKGEKVEKEEDKDEKEKSEEEESEESSEEESSDSDDTPETTSAEKKKKTKKSVKIVEVTQDELDTAWDTIDGDDGDDFDEEGAKAFDYTGFNADLILEAMLKKKKTKNFSDKKFNDDISMLASLAQKKGSVNDHNYTKMSKQGQTTYDRLAKDYGIKKGSGKGEPADVITVSRIGPTFPGRIMQLILVKKLQPKTFSGQLKSNTLPNLLQTQAFPPIIPKGLPERSKDFLLCLSIAYGADQSVALSSKKTKKLTTEEAIIEQSPFVQLSHGSKYPKEEIRVKRFMSIGLVALYDKMQICAKAFQKVAPEFVIPTKAEFTADLAKLKA